MSSVTLTESPGATAPPVQGPSSIRPWHFFALASLAVATAGAIHLRNTAAAELVLSILTLLAAGSGAVALYRTLQPLGATNDVDQPLAVGGRTRTALEQDKALTLRSIKELEFDRAMGKVSEADFDEMRGRLRARAVRLIRQLEGGAAYREIIERDLEARLAAADAGGQASLAPEASACSACGARTDRDARFCKMCGHALSA